MGGVFVGVGFLVSAPAWTSAQTGSAQAPVARFMQLAQLLINHRLDAAVGARIHAFAAKAHPDLPQLIDSLLAIAEKKQARIVEDFFPDVPEGEAKALALWIIFAFYSGVASPKPNAELFTFEQALTFQTTIDVVTIPSYGISGPDQWGRVNPPLSALPVF